MIIICIEQNFLGSENEMLNKLENSAKSNSLHQDVLLQKVKMQRDKIEMTKNPDEFKKLIDALSILLIEIEALLQQQSCKFTKTANIPGNFQTEIIFSNFR